MFGDSNKRHRRRKWKLHHLAEDQTEDKCVYDVTCQHSIVTEMYFSFREYREFLDDLEEDTAYRAGVNIYRDSAKLAVDSDDVTSDDDEAPRISLAEMINDLDISEDATGEDGAPMME